MPIAAVLRDYLVEDLIPLRSHGLRAHLRPHRDEPIRRQPPTGASGQGMERGTPAFSAASGAPAPARRWCSSSPSPGFRKRSFACLSHLSTRRDLPGLAENKADWRTIGARPPAHPFRYMPDLDWIATVPLRLVVLVVWRQSYGTAPTPNTAVAERQLRPGGTAVGLPGLPPRLGNR